MQTVTGGLLDSTNLMPLMNTDFVPGNCRKTVESMTDGVQRDISFAEYYYFSGRPEEAVKAAEPYLTSSDMGARLSACLIYTYANLSVGQIQKARFALGELNASLSAAGKQSPSVQGCRSFCSFSGSSAAASASARRNAGN